MKVGRLLASFAVLLCSACTDDPNAPGGGPVGLNGNTFTAVVDGVALNATGISAVQASGRVHIVAAGAFRTITLSVATPTAPGEVRLIAPGTSNVGLIAEGLAPNNPVWTTSEFVDQGVSNAVTFTSISASGATGTFAFIAGPAPGTPAVNTRSATGSFTVKF